MRTLGAASLAHGARPDWSLLVAALRGLSCLCLLLASLLLAPQPVRAGADFQRSASVSLPGGVLRGAVWLDDKRILVLQQTADGASVAAIDYESLVQTPFLGPAFLAEHICPAAAAGSLEWQLSPARQYIVFRWTEGAARRWALLDIARAPQFRLRRVSLPGGMEPALFCFSPDDRYLALAHDPAQEASAVSLLLLDLGAGREALRFGTHSLNFIERLWWDEAGGGLRAAARLYDGEFLPAPGLALVDMAGGPPRFRRPGPGGGVLLGGSARWGNIEIFAQGRSAEAGEESAPSFILQPSLPGQSGLLPIMLSAEPLQLACLSVPGLALLSNTLDYQHYELWLLGVLDGSRSLVDEDCQSFDLSPGGRLLVRGRASNSLRIYELRSDGY